MSTTRGLHPKTLPQRDGRDGHWSVLPPMADRVEFRDAPMLAVGRGIVWGLVALVAIIGGVLILASAIKPRTPQLAGPAEAHFHALGPRLEVEPPVDRAALERAHHGPGDAAIDRAMDQVVRQGWGDTAQSPSRTDVAMNRARAGQ